MGDGLIDGDGQFDELFEVEIEVTLEVRECGLNCRFLGEPNDTGQLITSKNAPRKRESFLPIRCVVSGNGLGQDRRKQPRSKFRVVTSKGRPFSVDEFWTMRVCLVDRQTGIGLELKQCQHSDVSQ